MVEICLSIYGSKMLVGLRCIKRMAYGYRDNAYFFLKIKAAFPEKAR